MEKQLITDVRLYVKIMAGVKPYGEHLKVIYFRNDLPLWLYEKWRWYFKYLEAKYKVEHPRHYTEYHQGSYPYTPPKTEQLKRLKDKITAKKAKITAAENQLLERRKNWSDLFPIEQDPRYEPTMQAINKLKFELKCMEAEYIDKNV